MKKEYKLIDRNLIRHFGKITISLEPPIGESVVREGKARPAKSGADRKSMQFPPSQKAVFEPPEEKAFEELGQDKRYPGPEDKLFSHIEK